MRIRIVLSPIEGRQTIGWDYQYKLAGLVYDCLRRGNRRLSRVYHTSTDFKMFTYSWLRGSIYPVKNGLVVDGPVEFSISSVNDEFIQTVFEGMYKGDLVRIGNASFEIFKSVVVNEARIRGNMRFKTLSPILVRTYREGKDNPHWDLTPAESMFFSNIRNNLIKKYMHLNYSEPEDKRLDFEGIKVFKGKRINIKGTWNRAWLMEFRVSGSRELIEIGYKAGFGEKNSMGFGMVEEIA